jgi:hypothetical protein
MPHSTGRQVYCSHVNAACLRQILKDDPGGSCLSMCAILTPTPEPKPQTSSGGLHELCIVASSQHVNNQGSTGQQPRSGTSSRWVLFKVHPPHDYEGSAIMHSLTCNTMLSGIIRSPRSAATAAQVLLLYKSLPAYTVRTRDWMAFIA